MRHLLSGAAAGGVFLAAARRRLAGKRWQSASQKARSLGPFGPRRLSETRRDARTEGEGDQWEMGWASGDVAADVVSRARLRAPRLIWREREPDAFDASIARRGGVVCVRNHAPDAAHAPALVNYENEIESRPRFSCALRPAFYRARSSPAPGVACVVFVQLTINEINRLMNGENETLFLLIFPASALLECPFSLVSLCG